MQSVVYQYSGQARFVQFDEPYILVVAFQKSVHQYCFYKKEYTYAKL